MPKNLRLRKLLHCVVGDFWLERTKKLAQLEIFGSNGVLETHNDVVPEDFWASIKMKFA